MGRGGNMGKEIVNKRGLSWQSALSIATYCERKNGKRKAIHSDLSFFGVSNEFQASQFEIHLDDKRKARNLCIEHITPSNATKAQKGRGKIELHKQDSIKRGNHYRAKFKRIQARKNLLYDGKEISFPYQFEFATSKGRFKIEESGKGYVSKQDAIQNCRAKLGKWWKKRFHANPPTSLKIKGRKVAENDCGIPAWELWVVDNSTARQFSDGPLLPPIAPSIGKRIPTAREEGLSAPRYWEGNK
jgi:hypothetical protein